MVARSSLLSNLKKREGKTKKKTNAAQIRRNSCRKMGNGVAVLCILLVSPALHSLYLRMFVHTVLSNLVLRAGSISRARPPVPGTLVRHTYDEQILFSHFTQGLLCVQEAGAYACETCQEFDLTKCSPEKPCCIHAENTSAFCFFGPNSRIYIL